MNPQIRLTASEQLDNLSLSGKDLDKTLSSLQLINIIFGNRKNLEKTLVNYLKQRPNTKKMHILDLGCGGGDCINYLSKRLKKHHPKINFTGIDGNQESTAYASRKNQDLGLINFVTADILDPDFMLPDCDVLISSHFIYHFSDQELVMFLKKLKSKNIKHIIFSELYRNRIAYFLFKYVSFILPISDIAKKDGLIAIQRAFSISELKKNIQKSDVTNFQIQKKPFFRMIIKIDL